MSNRPSKSYLEKERKKESHIGVADTHPYSLLNSQFRARNQTSNLEQALTRSFEVAAQKQNQQRGAMQLIPIQSMIGKFKKLRLQQQLIRNAHFADQIFSYPACSSQTKQWKKVGSKQSLTCPSGPRFFLSIIQTVGKTWVKLLPVF
jgi:hypothetical protein